MFYSTRESGRSAKGRSKTYEKSEEKVKEEVKESKCGKRIESSKVSLD